MSLWRATFKHAQGTQTVDVIQHFGSAATDDPAGAEDIATDLSAAWASNFVPHMHESIVFLGVKVESIYEPTVGYDYIDSVTGALTSDPLPQFVVPRVRLQTGLSGRSFRGHWGIPGAVAVSLNDGNPDELSSAARGDYQLAVNDFYGDLAAQNHFVQVVSYVTAGAPRVGGPIATPVVNSYVTPELGSRLSRRE